MTFPKATNSAVCAEFPMGSELHFSQFIDKLSKFEELEQIIHFVKFKM